jgi:hypothetical protein
MNTVKICELYSEIDNIDPGSYQLKIKFEGNLFMIYIGNPLYNDDDEYSSFVNYLKRSEYAKLSESLIFKKYGINLNKIDGEIILEQVYITPKQKTELVTYLELSY